MRPYTLKRDILYHAIQGKLVPHDSDEGTGQHLVIENNKRRLEYSSDIQKRIGKGCKPIQESELPFDIPENWVWERFGNLVINYDSQRRPVTKSDRKTTKGLYDYYGATGAIDKVDEYIFDGEFLMIGEDGGNFFVDRDNSFIARGTFWANNHVHVVQPIVCDIGYLKVCLDAYDLPNLGLINGIAVPKLNQENMNSICVPIPPLAEQKLIVAKVEELLPLIDRYEQAWSRLEDFNKRFPVDMQKSILQMAIQGKLVEQRPEEGTAAELLSVAETYDNVDGQRVKQKVITDITDDDIAFELPDSWEWVKLGSVCTIARGGSPRPIKDYITAADDGVNWIKIGDTEKNGKYISSTSEKIKPSGVSKSRMVHPGDFLLTNSMSFGRPYILKIDGCIHDGWLVISQSAEVFDQDYLYWMLSSGYAYSQFCGKVSGAVVKNLNSDKVANSVFPLPPLAEQKRIVARLEELLPLCERLKS